MTLSSTYDQATPAAFMRMTLGLFMTWSALGKAMDPFGFAETVYDYGFGQVYVLSALVVSLELCLGLAVFFRIGYRWALVLTIATLVAFSFVYGFVFFYKGIEDCGCMGALSLGELSGQLVFVRNATLVAICCYLLVNDRAKQPRAKRPILVLVFAMPLAIGLWAYSQSQPSSVASFEHILVGREISETPFGRYFPISTDSSYMIYLFSAKCGACQRSMPNLLAYQREGLADRFFGIGLADGDSYRMTAEGFPVIYLPPKEFWGLTLELPTLFYIRQGKVIFATKGKLYSPPAFRSIYLVHDLRAR